MLSPRTCCTLTLRGLVRHRRRVSHNMRNKLASRLRVIYPERKYFIRLDRKR